MAAWVEELDGPGEVGWGRRDFEEVGAHEERVLIDSEILGGIC